MSVKDSNDLVSTPGCFDCKSWLFCLFCFVFILSLKIENNWNHNSSSNCHLKQSFALVSQIFFVLLFIVFKWIKFELHCHDAEMLHKALQEANPTFPEAKVLLRHCPLLVWRVSQPRMSTCWLVGLCPSWWERRRLPPGCQPRGVGGHTHRVAVSIQTHQWELTHFISAKAERDVHRIRNKC